MVLYDFYADWCPPCKAMTPIINEVEQHIEVVKINVDENPETAADYGVRSIPTYVLYSDNSEITRITGAMPKAKFFAELGLTI